MILLTGSTGFVGRHLVKMLQDSNKSFKAIERVDGELYDSMTWDKFLDLPITYVIHLANISSVEASWDSPKNFIDFNVGTTTAALEFCKKKNCPMIYFSSFVYELKKSASYSEFDCLKAKNPYAHSKILCENTINFYSESFNINTIIVRPFNIYGSGQSNNLLLGSIQEQLKTSNKIIVRDLKPRRDFIYIKDVISFVKVLLNYLPEGCETYNLGRGESFSVEEILIEIGKFKNIEYQGINQTRQSEISDCYADMSHVYDKFGWRPTYTLPQGLREMFV